LHTWCSLLQDLYTRKKLGHKRPRIFLCMPFVTMTGVYEGREVVSGGPHVPIERKSHVLSVCPYSTILSYGSGASIQHMDRPSAHSRPGPKPRCCKRLLAWSLQLYSEFLDYWRTWWCLTPTCIEDERPNRRFWDVGSTCEDD
jgi:hypothetical protein